jgi:hypothetical protein
MYKKAAILLGIIQVSRVDSLEVKNVMCEDYIEYYYSDEREITDYG